MNFTNKVVLITGASSGIGYSLAKSLPKENCSLALISRSKNILDELAAELKNRANKVISYSCDVGNVSQVRETFSRIKNDFGKVDIAVLNSGISHRMDIKKG